MQRSRIVGTGTYLPERVVTNDDLSRKMGIDTSDAWIRERTGIRARRIAAPGEATSDMAAVASKKALEMAGKLKQPKRMAERRSIDHDVVMFAALQQITKREQGRDLCHAGQRGIQQRSDFFAIEESAVLNNLENAFAVAFKKSLELAVTVNLPDGNFALNARESMGSRFVFHFQHVGKRVRGVRGHTQDRLARMARRQMQRQSAGDCRLSYPALSHDECQLSHRRVLPQRTRRTQRNLKEGCEMLCAQYR